MKPVKEKEFVARMRKTDGTDALESRVVTLAKPGDMTDKECSPLMIYRSSEGCASCWRMSWRERVSALLFGRCWIHVHSGMTQPPVALMVTRDVRFWG